MHFSDHHLTLSRQTGRQGQVSVNNSISRHEQYFHTFRKLKEVLKVTEISLMASRKFCVELDKS